MWWDRERWWVVLVPPLVAGLLMVLFFAVTDRWTDLENPVASQIALVAGLIGFGSGLVAQRVRNWYLAGIPAAITLAVLAWAWLAPSGSPEDREFRSILAVLGVLFLVTTIAVNLPQVVRGRRAPAR